MGSALIDLKDNVNNQKNAEEELDKFVAEVERTAFEFYEAIAVPGAVAPEMPEFLYNEEVEIDLEDVM